MATYAELSAAGETIVARGVVWVVEQRPPLSTSTEPLGIHASVDGVSFDKIAEVEAPCRHWTDGPDLLIATEPVRRLSAGGSVSEEPDAAPPPPVIDLATCAALGASSFDRQRVARVGSEVWFIDLHGGKLRRAGAAGIAQVALGDRFDTIEAVAGGETCALVYGEAGRWGVYSVDAAGAVRELAEFDKPALALRRLFAAGPIALWSTGQVIAAAHELGGSRRLLEIEPPEGFLICGVDGGELVAAEFKWEPRDGARAPHPRPAHALRRLAIPAIEAATEAPGPQPEHALVSDLPISERLRAALHGLGIERVGDLDVYRLAGELDAADPTFVTEALYARAVGPGGPRINAGFLAGVETLELSPEVTEALRASAPTIGLLLQRTEAELLKTRGIGRAALQKIKEVVRDRGWQLGTRLRDLGER